MEPKFIGDRVSFVKTKDYLSVIITQEISRLKESLLLAWLLAWTFCGILFIYAISNAQTRDERMFLVIVVAFWAFFFVRITKVFLWRKAGKELIRITPGQLSIKNGWWSYGKAKFYHLDNIKDFGVIPLKETNFLQSMDRSFWVIGGDAIGFKYLRKRIHFGKQLNETDATQLARLIEKNIREFRKKN